MLLFLMLIEYLYLLQSSVTIHFPRISLAFGESFNLINKYRRVFGLDMGLVSY